MREVERLECGVLRVGIWCGSTMDNSGRLLYRTVLDDAAEYGIRGGTACGTIEGSQSKQLFRTVENEVVSSDLPVSIEFVDHVATLYTFAEPCLRRIGKNGVVALETADVWVPTDVRRRGWSTVQSPKNSEQTQPAQNGLQVQVFTLEQNQINGKPVYQAVAELLRHHQVLWISTARGVIGFGEQQKMWRSNGWFRKSNVPIVMTILDRVERLQPCLTDLVTLVGAEGLVVSKPVVWYGPDGP